MTVRVPYRCGKPRQARPVPRGVARQFLHQGTATGTLIRLLGPREALFLEVC
ncbi:uncharacterized protein K444DRAFT_611322 [Hyaloscypha bicolor E]|uniref:Uncharacterized protein n=1 Tax=Hyaloscypha bicolor E TaxID=1095630 RepID=A0A2J6TGH5_9HELO|nr:uncharacterized protein K444DRAFT_611322 [Hyaloscypha bicolor E]PMD62125.1 hypothetical protein K444DRAFT_611322 [Hyaloscypha bicolor E]